MQSKSYLFIIIERLADIGEDIVNSAGRILVVSWEGVQRTWCRLDFRLYSERRRVHTVADGLALKPGNKVAVFVVYARGALPAFTMNFIQALNRRSYNVIIVSNADLDAAEKAALRSHCCLLVERVNVGRDFGGYKDGISIALQRFPCIHRLIIGNDSVYYLQRGLDELVARLDGSEDFIGVSEVFEHHYHVASFLLSFGPGVLADPAFHRFWARYRPIHTRMWAILEGEGDLTRVLTEAGHRPHVLFRAENLGRELRTLSVPDAKDALALFSAQVREAISPMVGQGGTASEWSTVDFAESVVKEVMARNQMHAAGFAFMKFMRLALCKRDIVYRGSHSLQEVKRIVAKSGESEAMQAAIIADLARRPPPGRREVLRRLFYRHGHI